MNIVPVIHTICKPCIICEFKVISYAFVDYLYSYSIISDCYLFSVIFFMYKAFSVKS